MKLQKIYKLLFILSLYSIILISFRIYYTQNLFYLFLVWNLFLATIPLVISNYLKRNNTRFKFVLLFSIWLLFLPNAPYIITDLFHLPQGTEMPIWFDLLLLVTFSVNGMLLFFMSLNDMFNILKKKYAAKITWLLTYIILFLCGFGIYLGRYLRFNSWDVLNNPLVLLNQLLQPIIHPFNHPKTWGITLGYGFLFVLLFLIFKANSLKKGHSR